MIVEPPPRTTRFLFWATGRRVPPEHRAWVAEQLARPDYQRRRLLPAMAFQLLVLAGPVSSGLASGSRVSLLAPLVAVVFDLAVVATVLLRRRPLSEDQRRRLLAYHGVTADGALAPPVSAWGTNPLGKAGTALFAAQVLVLSSGVAVAADRISARRACHLPAAADRAALAAVVGVPVRPVSGPPVELVPPGTPLLAAREVDTGLPGVRYVAAYVREGSRRLGPAVWRVIEPGSALDPTPTAVVSAADGLALLISPTVGYSTGTPADPAVEKARDCARAAA